MPNYVERRSYLKKVKEKPEDTPKSKECWRRLFAQFQVPFVSVLETFGGAGILRVVLEEQGLLDANTRHETWEFAPDCVEFLREQFPTSVVRSCDSFDEPITPGWELISADFNSWTYLRFTDFPLYRAMTERLFSAGARYVQLTDSAVNKIHLNAPAYAQRFKKEIRPDHMVRDYVDHLDLAFREKFGYSVVHVTHHANASYLLFQRGHHFYPSSIEKVG